jgi:cell division septal protein FtsQ
VANEGRLLPFKRRAPTQAPPRRRRRNPWLGLAGALGAALAAVGLPVGLVIWVLSSPRFVLRTLDVEGGRFASSAWTRTALQPILGRNLAALRLADVERLVASHPWVATVELRKVLPDRLAVRVIEKRPAALIRQDDERLAYVDEGGIRIAPFEPELAATFGEFFLVSGGELDPATVARAIALGRRLEALRPDWGSQLSEVEALSEEDFRLVTAALPFPFVLRYGAEADAGLELEAAVERLERLVPELEARYEQVESVDLRGGRRVIVRPAAA